MLKYVLKRIIASILTLFVVITLTFFLMHAIPGGPFANERITQQTIDMMNEKYGLDKPVPEQFVRYLERLLHLDLGVSFKRQGFTVLEIILEKFAVSAKVGIIAITLALVIGIPTGIIAALKRNTIIDRIVMFITTLGIALPGFIVATILLYVFAINLQIVPAVGLRGATSYIMPALSLSFYPMCYISRLTRSNMLDVFSQDYIRTATAKGLPQTKVLFKHALKNTIIPVLTYMGPAAAGILTGGFVVEKIFSIPGLGDYFIGSITGRDYPMVMGTTIFLSALIIFINLIVDVLYSVIDPRIKLD